MKASVILAINLKRHSPMFVRVMRPQNGLFNRFAKADYSVQSVRIIDKAFDRLIPKGFSSRNKINDTRSPLERIIKLLSRPTLNAPVAMVFTPASALMNR